MDQGVFRSYQDKMKQLEQLSHESDFLAAQKRGEQLRQEILRINVFQNMPKDELNAERNSLQQKINALNTKMSQPLGQKDATFTMMQLSIYQELLSQVQTFL